MSVVLVPLTFDAWIEQMLSRLTRLTKKEKEQLEKIVYLLDQEVFTPIFEADNKEMAIEQSTDKFAYYLMLLSTPLRIKLSLVPEVIAGLYQEYRKNIKDTVKNPRIRTRILKILDLCEEHDIYFSRLFLDRRSIEFLEKVGIEDYVRAILKMMLSLSLLSIALERGEFILEWVKVAEKYADELEPYVATFQVFLEPDLAYLRRKASKQKIKEAKEVRGTLVAMES